MAVFSGDIRSATLAMDTRLQVILPYDRPPEGQPFPCKVLYLLHGLGDNASTWCQRTCIERYARDWGIAVVMPEVQRSFYIDMAMGLRYGSYIAQELPALCARMFQLSPRREDTFIAGLSMGGYGALRCALSAPERFAACASFSGVVDIHYLLREHLDDTTVGQLKALFGNDLRVRPENDLRLLADKVCGRPRELRPRVFMTCGQQDFLYDINLDIKAYFETLPLDFTFREWPGEHVWTFWDRSVQMALEFFLAPHP